MSFPLYPAQDCHSAHLENELETGTYSTPVDMLGESLSPRQAWDASSHVTQAGRQYLCMCVSKGMCARYKLFIHLSKTAVKVLSKKFN